MVAAWYDCDKDCDEVNVSRCQSQDMNCVHKIDNKITNSDWYLACEHQHCIYSCSEWDKDELKKRDTGNFRIVDATQLKSLNNQRVNLTDTEVEQLKYVTEFIDSNIDNDLQKRDARTCVKNCNLIGKLSDFCPSTPVGVSLLTLKLVCMAACAYVYGGEL